MNIDRKKLYKDANCIDCKKLIWRWGTLRCSSCHNRKRATGVIFSKQTREKISNSKIAENNPMWAGDNVGYEALHRWVRSRLPKPSLCVQCNNIQPIDLANKGIYDRNLENWEWLCRRCHMSKDGRMSRLHTKENRTKASDTVRNNGKPRKTHEEKLEYWRNYHKTRRIKNANDKSDRTGVQGMQKSQKIL